MHDRRSGDDVSGREPGSIVARPVGHHSPGFAHEQRAGCHVPRAERLLEVTVEDTGGGPGEVKARRSRPPKVLEATDMTAKCPSKYDGAETPHGAKPPHETPTAALGT